MLRVCGIVVFLQRHWDGTLVDWNFAKKAALLHDVGNVVKGDLAAHPEILADEKVNLDYWIEAQKRAREKYGTDDHEATRVMLESINTSPEITEVIMKKSFGNAVATAASDDWQVKILAYADFRVLPHGIGTLDERISDIRKRMPWYTSRPDFESLVTAVVHIEQQIAAKLSVTVDAINDANVLVDKSELETVL